MAKKNQPKREYIEHNVTIGDNVYRYEESGKGEKILLLPGGGMEPGLYSRIAAELSRDFCVINLARIGRAKMPPRREDLTLDEEADYFLPLLTELGIDYIIGHSSGAVLAAVLAGKMPVKGVVIYEPPICDRFDWLEPFRKLHDGGHYVRAIRYAMKGMSAAPFDTLPRIITLPIFYFVYKQNKPYVLTFEDCILSEMKGLNAVHDAVCNGYKIKVPALVCYGEATSPMLRKTTEDYFAACEQGTLKTYPKYSHINPLMDPVPFCTDVRAFIAGLAPVAPVTEEVIAAKEHV